MGVGCGAWEEINNWSVDIPAKISMDLLGPEAEEKDGGQSERLRQDFNIVHMYIVHCRGGVKFFDRRWAKLLDSLQQLSQHCLNQIGNTQCSSDREFPEFFKTPQSFIPGVIIKEDMAN